MTHNEKVDYLFSIMRQDNVDPYVFAMNCEDIPTIKEQIRQCNTKQDIFNLYGTLV